MCIRDSRRKNKMVELSALEQKLAPSDAILIWPASQMNIQAICMVSGHYDTAIQASFHIYIIKIVLFRFLDCLSWACFCRSDCGLKYVLIFDLRTVDVMFSGLFLWISWHVSRKGICLWGGAAWLEPGCMARASGISGEARQVWRETGWASFFNLFLYSLILPFSFFLIPGALGLSLIHIWRCRRS